MLAKTKHHYGWIPDRPDPRDHPYVPSAEVAKNLPLKVDLRPSCPPIYDQGHLQSCTANAIAAAVQYDMVREREQHSFLPSRLFIYYNARALEGKTGMDTGSKIRNGIKSIARQGDCPEYLWPYRVTKYSVKPPRKCYRLAVRHKAVEYQRLKQNLKHFRTCLATGYPIIVGMRTYKSFESHRTRRTGVGRLPKPNEKPAGWHSVLAVGYDNPLRRFVLRNSWGVKWGMKGYFTLPYEYLLDGYLSRDFWTVRLVK